MKRLTYLLLSIALLFPLGTFAASPEKAVLNVFTYKADGTLLGESYGFLLDDAQTGVAAYSLFNDAVRAEVIDAKGKKWQVSRILGANSTYDLVKFRLESKSGGEALTLTTSPAASGSSLSMYNYNNGKKSEPILVSITNAADFDDYKYYDITALNDSKNFGCPLIDKAGKVVGIVQKNVGKDAKSACAIDARFVSKLAIGSLGSINTDLQKIQIPKALPADEKDALTFIYMMNTQNTSAARTALNDFIEAFPQNAEGYVNRANFFVRQGDYAAAESDYNKAISMGDNGRSTIKADGVHHAFGKVIYENALSGKPYSGWSLQKAYDEEAAAYAINPQPLYLQQQGQCLYAMKDYNGAAQKYREVNTTDFASPETFYAEALCRSQAGADSLEVLALMDSAVAHMQKPYVRAEAPYLYARAIQEIGVGKKREAVKDLNDYEKTVGATNLNARFYELRYSVERETRMYQQALDDIRTAQSKSSGEEYYLYRLEESSLLLQVGQFDEAIISAEDYLKNNPDDALCCKILGIAYGEKGKKAQAKQYLQRAQAGGQDVDALLQKYK